MSSSSSSRNKKQVRQKKAKRKHERQRRRRTIQEMDDIQYSSFLSLYLCMISALFFMFLSTIGLRGPDIHRVRKDIEKDIFVPLGPYYLRRSYRMHKESFYALHEILRVHLEEHFFPKRGGKRPVKSNPYVISTEIRLSIALRYFAGASPYDKRDAEF